MAVADHHNVCPHICFSTIQPHNITDILVQQFYLIGGCCSSSQVGRTNKESGHRKSSEHFIIQRCVASPGGLHGSSVGDRKLPGKFPFISLPKQEPEQDLPLMV